MSKSPTRDQDAQDLIGRTSALFTAAPENPQAPFRYPVLATIGRDGSPNGRVLVLRTANAVNWQATLHTDSRSEKVAELAENSAAMLVFYDHEAGLQMRLKGIMGRMADTPEKKAVWQALPVTNRPNYHSSLPTGSEISGADGNTIQPDSQSGYENFDVLHFTAETVDILQLTRAGNRRYRLDILNETGAWLVP
jgi:pyridoxamine 5'-phosphate oxidase